VEGVGRKESCIGGRKDSRVLAGRRRKKKKSLIINSSDARRSIIMRPRIESPVQVSSEESIELKSPVSKRDAEHRIEEEAH